MPSASDRKNVTVIKQTAVPPVKTKANWPALSVGPAATSCHQQQEAIVSSLACAHRHVRFFAHFIHTFFRLASDAVQPPAGEMPLVNNGSKLKHCWPVILPLPRCLSPDKKTPAPTGAAFGI